MVLNLHHPEDSDVISTVSLSPRRAGFLARLTRSCRDDLGAYRDGVIRDLRSLAADAVTAWLAVAVLLSQFGDATSTVLALANNWPEQNPLSAAVIARWGMPGLFLEKVAIIITVVFNMARLRGRSARVLGLLAVLVGVAAVVWNLHVAA
jgi:hypothetical protein